MGKGFGATEQAATSEEALDRLRAECAAEPNRADPRIRLATALLALHRAAEAVTPAEQAAAFAPGLAEAVKLREAVLAAVLAGDPDLVKLELSAALAPDDAEAQLSLGGAYAALDRPHDAERCFKKALRLGRAKDATADLASLYLAVGMLDAAEHHAKAVLAEPDLGAADDVLFAMAAQTLASVAQARGEAQAAEAWLDQAYSRRSLFRQRVGDCSFTSLVLVSRRQGNIAYRNLLPPLRSDCLVWYMEHARLEQAAELPPYAVVLNAIGDPDVAMASDALVEAFTATCGKPVLNPPARIRATFRHGLRETLARLDDVIVPETVRLGAAVIAEHGLAGAVAAVGLSAPVLVRPLASHGGEGLVLARDGDELAAVAVPEGADVYVTRFHDYRSADGYFRKYRMIFVDRRPHAYHLGIGPHWMVHHQTSGMEADEARKAEELAFLRDPRAAIGARAMAAVAAIGARLDLDYGGVDFTVTGEGQVLVFEANATMLTHLEPEDGSFAAKNPFIAPIIAAFQAHLARLAGSA